MYTQCPACKTVFRLHPDQIHAAQGQVRCSRCHAVFNAVENLFRQPAAEPSVEEQHAPTTTTPEAASARQESELPAQPAAAIEASPDKAAEEAVTQSVDTLLADSGNEDLPEEAKPAETFEEEEIGSPVREEASATPEEALERLPEEANDDFAPGHAEEAAQTELFEALQLDEEEPGAQEEEPAEEALRLFADEAKEEHHPPSAAEADEALSAEQSAPLREEEEAFDEELLSIFDEESGSEAEPETPAEPAPAPASAEAASQPVEESLELPAAAMGEHAAEQPPLENGALSEKKPKETASWDPFSEENIEALLTSAEEHEPIKDGGVFAEQKRREPLISEDELDLSDWSEPAPEMVEEEDEALLSQRLPEDSVVDELDLDTLELKSDSRGTDAIPEIEPDSPSEATARPSYSLPLEQEPARGSLFGSLLWGSGIVLMLAGLGLQYLYYHRNALAENPQLRPVLAQICQVTGCQLPPRRDLARIELGNHLVQFHPRYVDSLLITATLVNRADFAQPFPIVEVVMTDLEQKVIARRRFLPDDYLIGGNTTQGLPPGTEVPLMLEVLDPGKKAVGFEFNFY